MSNALDRKQALEPSYLIIDWHEIEATAEGESVGASLIEKSKVKEAHYSFQERDSWPLNGKLITAKVLSIELTFQLVEGGVENVGPWPGIMFDIHATPDKLKGFGDIGSSIQFNGYVCTDEWEVMTTLYRFEHLDMLDGELIILDKTPSSITLSITGKLKYHSYDEDEKNKPNPKFYFQHEFAIA